MTIVIVATLLGGSHASRRFDTNSDVYFGLDFFFLNLIFLSIIFVPIERLLKKRDQPIFRDEWREDMFYFFVSTLFVQGLTYASLTPALTVVSQTGWLASFREMVASQPLVLQFIEIHVLHRSRTILVPSGVPRNSVGCGNSTQCIIRGRSRWTGLPAHVCTCSRSSSCALARRCRCMCWDTLNRRCTRTFSSCTCCRCSCMRTCESTLGSSNTSSQRLDFITGIMESRRKRSTSTTRFTSRFWIGCLERITCRTKNGREGYGIHGHPVPQGYLRQFLYPFKAKKKQAGKGE